MTEETLKLIRKEYQKRKKAREVYNDMLASIKILEEDETVKKYLDIKDKIANFSKTHDYLPQMVGNWTDDVLLDDTLKLYTNNNDETEEVMVCCGAFTRGLLNDSQVFDESGAEYKLYIDLEKDINARVEVPIREVKDYELTHIIVDLDMPYSEKNFYKFKRRFYKDAIKNNSEHAYCKVLENMR